MQLHISKIIKRNDIETYIYLSTQSIATWKTWYSFRILNYSIYFLRGNVLSFKFIY